MGKIFDHFKDNWVEYLLIIVLGRYFYKNGRAKKSIHKVIDSTRKVLDGLLDNQIKSKKKR